jgi:hypothetical protein
MAGPIDGQKSQCPESPTKLRPDAGEVYYKGDQFVIERADKPMAAVVLCGSSRNGRSTVELADRPAPQ